MNPRAAVTAATRFGLGARPGEIESIGSDPHGWLKAQLSPAASPSEFAGLPTTLERVEAFRRARGKGESARKKLRKESRKFYRLEVVAQCLARISSSRPFFERWVAFFSNHFTVSTSRVQITGVVGAFEREVIRTHALGSFRDLLLAVARHPAMLGYLDNAQSIGPQSVAGKKRGKGLNENLAREVLELHTLGVDGGYSQQDVIGLAEILTGWTIGNREDQPAFVFARRRHEPGEKVVLGKRYSGGEAEGVQALSDLAVHPSTARHLARKLAQHFVADDPPESAITRLEQVFRDSEGDLTELATAVIELKSAWTSAGSKLKTPIELVISMGRAIPYDADGSGLFRALRLLGQLPFTAPSPAGWPDRAEEWIGPDAMLARLDIVQQAGEFAANRVEHPLSHAEELLAGTLSGRTRVAIAAAPSPSRAFALLFASPEFQRR